MINIKFVFFRIKHYFVHKFKIGYGKETIYYLNYSPKEQIVTYQGIDGVELFGDTPVKEGETVHIPAWDLKIVER